MELRSGSEGSWRSDCSSIGSASKYRYTGRKYGNDQKKKLVRCSAKTLKGKRCSRKCDSSSSVCYQHKLETRVDKIQSDMDAVKCMLMTNDIEQMNKIIIELVNQIQTINEEAAISQKPVVDDVITYVTENKIKNKIGYIEFFSAFIFMFCILVEFNDIFNK